MKKVVKTSEGTVIYKFANYKEVKGAPGFKMPFTFSLGNEQGEQKIDMTSIEANTGIKPESFK